MFDFLNGFSSILVIGVVQFLLFFLYRWCIGILCLG